MKSLLLIFVSTLLFTTVNAQGLENIIIEKYYVSDANDTMVNSVGGVLPVGSVTYRVYVDMLPEYILQAVYGDANHECRIETSTLFFNNEDRGATTPTFSKNFCDDNTVMLDSWLSVGAACSGNFGILKDQDDGVATVVNGDGVLQNNDPFAGIPLTSQDGLIAGMPEPVTLVGITTEIMVFDAQNDGTNGPLFSTNNGSWASLNGSTGPDSTINQVLIAQITTNGIFSFQLNVQIRDNVTNTVENYVASNPVGNEIFHQGLTYYSDSTTALPNENNDMNTIMTLFPVPAKNEISIKLEGNPVDEKATFEIYDVTGKIMLQKQAHFTNSLQTDKIDISFLTPGVYVVLLNNDGFISAQKFIRE